MALFIRSEKMKRATQGSAAALTCILTLVLLVVPKVVVEAADPPYVPPPPPGHVAWDDNLIGQKLAQIFPGDPDPYVTEGRFYDVGRKPDPVSPPATDYGDYRFRVTHIKFDWKKNDITPVNDDGSLGTPTFSYDEAQTMMYSAGSDLDHVKDDKVKGEWIYKYATFDDDKGRSEPALYVADKRATIKVRIECAAPVKYAYVGAKELRAPYPQGGQPADAQWLDVKKTPVAFTPLIVDPNTGATLVAVSTAQEQVGTDADGNPIYQTTEYVELPLDGTIKSKVDRSDIIWQWYVDRINPVNPITAPVIANEWTAAVVCKGKKDGWAINKSGEYSTIEITNDDGETQEFDNVLPHRFYTILDRSKYPWYDADDGSDQEGKNGERKPWANALDFAIVEAGRIELRGFSSIPTVATRVTEFFYRDFGLNYAHDGSAAIWVYDASQNAISVWVSVAVFEFHLGWCMTGVNQTVNCHDQALATATFTALIGGEAKYTTMEPFGYVTPSDFVGASYPEGNDCNNPFFNIVGTFPSTGKVDDDDTIWRIGPAPALLRKRSLFKVHAWMEMSSLVYDATMGAANSNDPRVGMTRADFKTAAIDLSHTAVNPWEDNEEMAAEVDSTGVMQGPKKAAGSDNPDPDYKNGDMNKAVFGTFRLKH